MGLCVTIYCQGDKKNWVKWVGQEAETEGKINE
jgi:hypothetical protein